MNLVWTDFARLIFHVQVQQQGPNGGAVPPPAPARSYQAPGSSTGGSRRVSYSSGAPAGAGALAAAAVAETGVEEPPTPEHVEQRRVSADEQLGRNDPCWCGSGKKFKRCHGA
jgi:preprotein translocase subunit SecA